MGVCIGIDEAWRHFSYLVRYQQANQRFMRYRKAPNGGFDHKERLMFG